MNFRNLHKQKHPLLLCNVWDVPSTKTAEEMNYETVATSSAAIAAILVYKYGE